MRVTLVQMDVHFSDKYNNIQSLKHLLAKEKHLGDIIVLPELYQGLTIGLAICFDLWFPEVIRRYTEKNTDVLLHLANFGGEQTLLMAQARAMENSLFICTCNRVGTENTKTINGFYRGNSQVVAPLGQTIFRAGQQAEVHTVELNVNQEPAKQFSGISLQKELSTIRKLLSNTSDS